MSPPTKVNLVHGDCVSDSESETEEDTSESLYPSDSEIISESGEMHGVFSLSGCYIGTDPHDRSESFSAFSWALIRS